MGKTRPSPERRGFQPPSTWDETVDISRESRAFHARQDIDAFFALFECRRRLEAKEPLESVLAQLPRTPLGSEWLEERRAKLLFRLAREFERRGQQDLALSLYLESSYRESRRRAIRVMEIERRYTEAHRLAQEVHANPGSKSELRNVRRVLKRLDRRLSGNRSAGAENWQKPPKIDVVLEKRSTSSVEYAAMKHLSEPEAPAFYVENALVNSLFGLWDAIFAPVAGAFFNRFQSGPTDLMSPDFRQRRNRWFDEGFQLLARGDYVGKIKRVLIQFWPKEKRYRLIEVKGPGDRLQDNQQGWFDYCSEHSMPIVVCHVRWTQATNVHHTPYFGSGSEAAC